MEVPVDHRARRRQPGDQRLRRAHGGRPLRRVPGGEPRLQRLGDPRRRLGPGGVERLLRLGRPGGPHSPGRWNLRRRPDGPPRARSERVLPAAGPVSRGRSAATIGLERVGTAALLHGVRQRNSSPRAVGCVGGPGDPLAGRRGSGSRVAGGEPVRGAPTRGPGRREPARADAPRRRGQPRRQPGGRRRPRGRARVLRLGRGRALASRLVPSLHRRQRPGSRSRAAADGSLPRAGRRLLGRRGRRRVRRRRGPGGGSRARLHDAGRGGARSVGAAPAGLSRRPIRERSGAPGQHRLRTRPRTGAGRRLLLRRGALRIGPDRGAQRRRFVVRDGPSQLRSDGGLPGLGGEGDDRNRGRAGVGRRVRRRRRADPSGYQQSLSPRPAAPQHGRREDRRRAPRPSSIFPTSPSDRRTRSRTSRSGRTASSTFTSATGSTRTRPRT